MKSFKYLRTGVVLALAAIILISVTGGTIAWFTDEAASDNNIIKSGTLDVTLDYYNGTAFEAVEEDTQLFSDAALWEPGHTQVAYLKVGNAGSLALKYRLSVNVGSETESTNVMGETFKLSDYLACNAVEITESQVGSMTREQVRAAAGTTMGLDSYAPFTGELEAGEADRYLALVVCMPESVGNEANHSREADAPTISLGVMLAATQLTSEYDAFGNDYDADATFPSALPVVNDLLTLQEALSNGQSVKLGADVVLEEGVQLYVPSGVAVTLDLNGHTITGGYQQGSTTKHVYPIDVSGDLVLTGGTVTGRGIGVQNGGNLTLNGTKVIAEDSNGGACVWSYGENGKIILNDAELIGYTGVVSANCPVEINGGSYTCYSSISDAGEQLSSPTYNIRAYNGLTINGGTFTSRHGVLFIGGGTSVIDNADCTIEFNAALTSNVVYIYGDADVTINSGSFISDDSNDIADSGAAVVVASSDAQLDIYGGTFVGMNGMVSGNSNTSLYGGTYSTVFDYNHYSSLSTYVADGYTATQNADDSWTISKN